jgi:NAD(P)-dependent dehydrogenase (short-subunit alcohol dehydrogenase family)
MTRIDVVTGSASRIGIAASALLVERGQRVLAIGPR